MTTSGLSSAVRWLTQRSLVARTTVSTPNFVADGVAVDGVDTGDVRGAGRFGDVGEQQPDGALADNRDVPPGQVR